MRRTLAISLVLALSLSLDLNAFEEVSSRMISLGTGLTGIVEDPFTDILRNPAYLAHANHRFIPITIGRDSRSSPVIRSGLFANPTPFLEHTMAGGLIDFESWTYRSSPTVEDFLPVDHFSIPGYSIRADQDHPPTDLIGRGRSFTSKMPTYYYGQETSQAIRGQFFYSIPIGRDCSFGINYLHGRDGIGIESVRYQEEFDSDDRGTYDWTSYYRDSYRSDGDERLNSLRMGIRENFGKKCSLDFSLTASRTRGWSRTEDLDYREYGYVYQDSTLDLERYTRQSFTQRSPLEREAIEADLYLHRDGERGKTALRISFFSGDAGEDLSITTTSTENDSVEDHSETRLRNRAGWSGGLAGIGGSRELRRRPITLYWGAFYGFTRAWEIDRETTDGSLPNPAYPVDESPYRDYPTSEVLASASLLTVRETDNWDNHLWQFNLATEYEITRQITARLGGRATAVLTRDRLERETLAEYDSESSPSSTEDQIDHLIADAGLTGGVGLDLTRRIHFDIFTPDLSSLSSWIFEGFVRF